MRRRPPALLTVSLLCLGLSLSACASRSHQASSKPTSTAGAAATAQPTESHKPTKHGSFEVVPLPSLSPTPTPTPSRPAASWRNTPAPPATPPAGYQTAKAPLTSISFAVPASWEVFNAFNASEKQRLAEITGLETSELETSTSLMDLMATAPTWNAEGYREQMICSKIALPLPQEVIEKLINDYAAEDGLTVVKISSVESANGTIHYGVTYNPGDGVYIAHAYLPRPQGSQVTSRIYTFSTERAEELLGVVASTLR